MAKVTVTNDRYTVDALYQWDLNQTLYIYGVNVLDPEIHLTNDNMAKSIVVQPKVDKAGVISLDIPNSLLQTPTAITVYICGYEHNTFKTYYKVVIPVKARTKPGDYVLDANDGEVYSFETLNKRVTDLEAAMNIDGDQTLYRYTYNTDSDNLVEASGKHTTKKYLPLVSTSLKAIKSIIDKIKTRLSNLETKTDDLSKRIDDEVDTLNDSIETAKMYQIPWNVSDNLGKININSSTIETSTADYPKDYTEKSFHMFMKNSGDIYLDFTIILKTDNNRTENYITNYDYSVTIFINDKEFNSYTDIGDHRVLLSVAKGDIVTITLKSKCLTEDTWTTSFDVTNVNLVANVETAYTYNYLSAEENVEESVDDILNALLGV